MESFAATPSHLKRAALRASEKIIEHYSDVKVDSTNLTKSPAPPLPNSTLSPAAEVVDLTSIPFPSTPDPQNLNLSFDVEVIDLKSIHLPSTLCPSSSKSEKQSLNSVKFTFNEKCYSSSKIKKLTKDESCYNVAKSSKVISEIDKTVLSTNSLFSVDKTGNFSPNALDLLQMSYSNLHENIVNKKSISQKRKHVEDKEDGELSSPEVPSPQSIWNKAKTHIELYDKKPIVGRQSLPAYLQTPTSLQHPCMSLSSTPTRLKHTFSNAVTPPPFKFRQTCEADQTPYIENEFRRQKRFRASLPSYDPHSLAELESEWGFIDSHCHLDFLTKRQGYEGTFAHYQIKYKDTFPKCYKGCLAVFCNPYTFGKSDLWERFLAEENVWGTFGCHPHNAKDYNDAVEIHLCKALDHPKVRAIGEIGLDYSNRNNCLRESQFSAFRRQLRIGLDRKLPVVIHCREAHQDAIRIIKEILPVDHPIHLHCFTDTWDWAEKWLSTFPNLAMGLTNVVTFHNAQKVHQVARMIPLKRLLLETDAPYFVPPSIKGTKFSHPGMAIHVAAQVAAIKGIPIEKVLKAARQNTRRIYNI